MKEEDINRIPIKDKNFDKYEEIQTLIKLYHMKNDVSNRLKEIEENLSPENKEIINDFKNLLKEEGNNTFNNNIKEFIELENDIKAEKIQNINRHMSFFERLKNAFSKDVNINPGRLIGLTDGIFGMGITLLAFGISLPDITITSSADFTLFIQELFPNIGIVLVSFVLLSSFWIYHHEFMKIKTLNLPFLWLNVIFLACISFIPFTTSVIGHYSHFFYAEVIFGFNIFITILSFLAMHTYAAKRNLLEEEVSAEERKYTVITFIMLMILTMTVNLLDFIVSPNFIYLFLLVPVISTLRDLHINKLLR